VYEKIVQPEKWSQWVKIKAMDFGEGKIINCQDFMNLADIQYKQILSSGDGQFKGFITTVTEDIVAMMANARIRKNTPPNVNDSDRDPKSQKEMHLISSPIIKTPKGIHIKLETKGISVVAHISSVTAPSTATV